MSRLDPEHASGARDVLLAIVSARARGSTRWAWLLLAAAGIAVATGSAAYWVRSRWIDPAPPSIAMSLGYPDQSPAQDPAGREQSSMAADTGPAPMALTASKPGAADTNGTVGNQLLAAPGRSGSSGKRWHAGQRYYASRWHTSSRRSSYRSAPARPSDALQARESAPAPELSAASSVPSRAASITPPASDANRRSAIDRYQKQLADAQAANAAYAADQAAYQQEMARSRKAQEDYDKGRRKKDH